MMSVRRALSRLSSGLRRGNARPSAAELAELAEFPEMNPGPVLRLDRQGIVIRANAAARKVFGGSELDGRCWLDLCPEMTSELWQRALTETEPVQHETEVNGCSLVFTHAHKPGGEFVFVYGADITERRQAEQALAQQARELAEMATFPEMNPGPVLRLDRQGIVIRANAAARKVFGADLDGRCWLDLCPQITSELWQRALTETEPVQHETAVNTCSLVFTHAHKPGSEFVFVYGADITARREAEQVLAQQARELAEMARFPDMNPGPVFRLDRGGNVMLANKAARELFGEEALSGRCWVDLCPGIDRAFWDRVLAATAEVTQEAQIGDRWLLFTHTPGAGGGNVFVYGADVTEQRMAERALRQSEKMATLGTLAAGVAHELNNPGAAAQRASEQLGEVFGRLQEAQLQLGQFKFSDGQMASLAAVDKAARERAADPATLDALSRSDLEYEVESWLDDHAIDDAWELAAALVSLGFDAAKLSELEGNFASDHLAPVIVWLSCSYPVYSLLQEIRHGTGRLAEIVSALKAYSYVGQGPVHDVDVNEGLRNTLVILRNKLKYGITVDQELAGDLPTLQGYGGELNQVWTNLIDNAASALEGEGRIALRTFREDGWVVVEVEDNGPGIPEEFQPRIFDPFFTTKAPGEGTGLGLNTTYNIVVQKHRGKISVDSKPGRTRFVVKLPIEPESVTRQAAPEAGEVRADD